MDTPVQFTKNKRSNSWKKAVIYNTTKETLTAMPEADLKSKPLEPTQSHDERSPANP